MEDRPISEPTTWECPECHDLWEIHLLGPTDPAPAYRFIPEGGGYHVTPAEWVRVGPAAST